MRYITDDIEVSLPAGWVNRTTIACTPDGATAPAVSIASVPQPAPKETPSQYAHRVLEVLHAQLGGFELVRPLASITVDGREAVDMRYAFSDRASAERMDQRTVIVIGCSGAAIHITSTANPDAGVTAAIEMEEALNQVLAAVRLPGLPPPGRVQ